MRLAVVIRWCIVARFAFELCVSLAWSVVIWAWNILQLAPANNELIAVHTHTHTHKSNESWKRLTRSLRMSCIEHSTVLLYTTTTTTTVECFSLNPIWQFQKFARCSSFQNVPQFSFGRLPFNPIPRFTFTFTFVFYDGHLLAFGATKLCCVCMYRIYYHWTKLHLNRLANNNDCCCCVACKRRKVCGFVGWMVAVQLAFMAAAYHSRPLCVFVDRTTFEHEHAHLHCHCKLHWFCHCHWLWSCK